MKIQVITGSGQPVDQRYMLSMIVELWEAAGHTVTYTPADVLDADIGVVHLDLTVVPSTRLPRNPHRRPLLNGGFLDISKSVVSTQLVRRGDGYNGPVIVKTDANSTGAGERVGASRWHVHRVRRRLTHYLPWTLVRALPTHYPVLDSAARVPGWVWGRPDLVVERFTPEREGGEYVLRTWLFFGDQEYSAKLYGPHPVVKTSNMTHYDYLDDVPDSLRRRRAELGADFGKFDYVMVDGEAILLDANKTPTMDRGDGPGPNVTRLATGLDSFTSPGQRS